MYKLQEIKGLTIRRWAEADLPHGAFTAMVREVDPFYGVYADAGARKKTYRVSCSYWSQRDQEDIDAEIQIKAFDELHAMGLAHDEYGRPASAMEAALVEARRAET